MNTRTDGKELWDAWVLCPGCGASACVMGVLDGYDGGYCSYCGTKRHVTDCVISNLQVVRETSDA